MATESGIDYAAELNSEQLAAVQAPDGPVLVIAAAGTGKTRTLIYRVAYLVEQGINPNNILLLTFTNRAANEMLERARDLVGPAVSGLWGGTFHHLANRILRRHAEAIDYRVDFTILDSDDQKTLMRNIILDLGLKDKQFPKPDVLLSLYSFALNTEQEVEGLLQDRFGDHPISLEDIGRVYDEYERRKGALNAMDFDDLLVNTVSLFRKNPSILEQYQERFYHIMVDEYQDTNYLQAELVDLLAAKHKNLLVVGDDFQSIYSWRGANYRNIIDFPDKYEGTTIFKLVTNYRSVPEILEVANGCIAGNPEQFQKELKAVREMMGKPTFVEPRSGDDQAKFIIQKIREFQRDGYPINNICILYRAHFHAMEMQIQLARERIPYQITSGVRFFEQVHIKDVCSFLRLMHNPGDELAFLRLITLLPKVGPKTALKIWRNLEGRFDFKTPGAREKLIAGLPKGAQPLWQRIDSIFDRYEQDGLAGNPSEVVHYFLEEFYDQYAVENFENYPRRIEDVQEVIQYVGQFNSLGAFLEEMALLTNIDKEAENLGGAEEASVKLSTVHQAKGLEWDVVFMLWVSDGMFPSGRSLDEEEGESEERRLFYVATTRAKDHLIMLSPQVRRQRDGGMVFYSPSRFISELPEELFQIEKPAYFY